MPSSFIPQRIKRARQQITVKLYQDQLAMLDSYGRFIDDSRDYIISQALELVFKRDKEFGRWLEQQRNANRDAERIVTRTESAGSHHCLDHSVRGGGSILVEKPWAKWKENRRSKWRIES